MRTVEEWKAMETWDVCGSREQPAYKAYHSAYCEFMSNLDNTHDCEHCPHGADGYEGHYPHYPCGQQNCWVSVHCKEAER